MKKKPKPKVKARNWKRQALAAERLRFETIKSWQTKKDAIRLDLLALGVAHEFNNILGAASGHAEWALESKKPSEMQEALEIISLACRRCAEITKSLQGIVQPREEEKAILSLKNLFIEIIRLWKNSAEKISVNISSDITDVNVYLDAGAFTEILSNLFKNSLEALEKTGRPGEIAITTEITDGAVKIFYNDNGPGIPAPFQPYLFQPFFSTKGSIRAVYSEGTEEISKGKNSGLGLFLSRALAQEVGGDLELVNSPQGAVFLLTLPIVE